MTTAFVYTTDESIERLSEQEIAQVFEETGMHFRADKLVVLDASANGLDEFHEEVVTYASALPPRLCADVHFHACDLPKIKTIVTELMGCNANVGFQLTEQQRRMLRN